MTMSTSLPTAYAAFFEQAFDRAHKGRDQTSFVFFAADLVEAIDECRVCEKPVINLTAFVEGIGEHYLLTDPQRERLEAELTDSGLDVSDDDVCNEHAEEED